MAHPGGLPGQCRGAAAVGLAARRLSRGVLQRHGVSVGVHDQDRGLCPAGRLSGYRAADLFRPLHDLLRDHLRAAGKRHAAHPGLQHRQSGRLHGRRHRYRHADGAQRRGVPRLCPHHLQGAAVDGGGVGVLHDGQAQMHRAGRAVPQHAADGHVRHHRRPVDLGIPADLGLHDEVDDLPGRVRPKTYRSPGSC